jgi:hypothetical protein
LAGWAIDPKQVLGNAQLGDKKPGLAQPWDGRVLFPPDGGNDLLVGRFTYMPTDHQIIPSKRRTGMLVLAVLITAFMVLFVVGMALWLMMANENPASYQSN